ncbi:MAG: hypothetical protein AAFZ52_17015 [Bacteroidota bacterium]
MKRLSLSLLFLCVCLLPAAQATPVPPGDLDGIEAKIEQTLYRAFMKRSEAPLTELRAEIAALDAPLADYWTAYTDFQLSIYYLKNQKHQEVTGVLNRAVSTLTDRAEKTSEELALLAYLQDFLVPFSPEADRQALSEAALEAVDLALEQDPINLRANYIRGRIAFFDGQTERAEELLRKAISLPVNASGATDQPSWGKPDAYELLVQHCMKIDRLGEAQKLLDEALVDFPDHYQLNMLVPKLKEAAGKK